MYELLVLSLLMHWPLHAYRIAKIANNIIGPEEQISTGTLSTLLSKLKQAGLIIPADPATTPFSSDRPSRVFTITPAGREHFVELMTDTTSHPGMYRRLFHIKALHLEFLPLEQQLFLVEHFLDYCRKILRSKQSDFQDMANNPIKQEHLHPAFRESASALIQLKQEQWQLELTWAESLRAQILLDLKRQAKEVEYDGRS